MSAEEIKRILDVIDSRSKNKKEFYTGVVLKDSVRTDSKGKSYNAVSILGDLNDTNYFILLNKTNKELAEGDSVIIHALNGDLTNGYIINKFGKDSVVLYDRSSGTTSEITFTESVVGAKYIDIFFSDYDNVYSSIRVSGVDKDIVLTTSSIASSPALTLKTYYKKVRISSSEGKLKVLDYFYVTENLSTQSKSTRSTNAIYVNKIIAYF